MEHGNHEATDSLCGIFSIIKLSFQNYAEVETDFARRFRNQLKEYWQVKKNDTDFHKIRFNNDYDNPLILIQGWNKIKAFHNLPDNVEIELCYYGDNIFEVFNVKEMKAADKLPRFHSRSIFITLTHYFDFEISPTEIDSPKFRLNIEFATFLQSYGFEGFNLCGDNGEKSEVGVLNTADLCKMKLGYIWNEFCASQQFKVGDKIRFKFQKNGKYASNRCHVFRICKLN